MPKDAGSLLQLAGFYHQLQREPEMARALQLLLNQPKNFPQGHASVGDFYLSIGKLNEAVREYQTAVASDRKQKTSYQKNMARALALQGKRDEAVAQLSDVLKEHPNDSDSRLARAIILRESNDLKKLDWAISELNSLIEKTPTDEIAHYNLGLAHLAKGDSKAARANLVESARLRPTYIPPRKTLAEIDQRERNYAETIRLANEILAVNPDDADARLFHAAGLLGSKAYQQARNEFGALLRQYPNSMNVNLHMAVLDTEEKKYSGTITNGVYTAPAMINTFTTIVLAVTSLADPSKTAQVPITLIWRPISIAVSPSQATLGPSGTAQFTATVQGGASAVVWSLSPNVGSISPSGVYVAPSTITQQQNVVIAASASADPSKTASATITLTGPTPPPPPPPIQLPVEVVGLDGMTATVLFNIPPGSNLAGAATLSMLIHGLRYETQASVQVNNSGWRAISDSTVTLLGNATAYGGIGGGFSTLKMTMSVPAGTLTQGTNTISFRFNGTDGRVSGLRVLSFNFQDGNGNSLLPAAAFVYEDPNTWLPPSSQSSDIAAGKSLWYTAPLTHPTPGGPAAIQAHCTDCHAQDGRDLKYFNYSNNSIRTRSMFHGLTAQQGDQIASYIRTLNVVNPGRPWNPPYQPGPGLDSKPVIEWAAGAGLDAVLDNDAQILNQEFPSGIQDSFFANTAHINFREMAVPFQFPDWNQWLPGTHPIDAYGTGFTTNNYLLIYKTIRAGLNVLDPVAYVNQKDNLTNGRTVILASMLLRERQSGTILPCGIPPPSTTCIRWHSGVK
jgi:tetratricopeptide (TPR) repeat protein